MTKSNGGDRQHRLRIPRYSLALAAPATLIAPAAATVPSAAGSSALVAGPGRMAEAAVAVDPEDPKHLAAAANPYDTHVHVEVTESRDGGATWSVGLVLLPEGTTKSYDPTPLFLASGRLVVVGGASTSGGTNCQPGSRIFVATLENGRAAYDVVQPPRPGVYVDRPTAAGDARSGSISMSWTESSGAGADCRGLPVRSQVVFRQWGESATCPVPKPLASTGSPAAFAAGLARAGDRVVAAVRELGPGARSRIVVQLSVDGGCAFENAQILDQSQFPPPMPAVSGGFAFGGPSAVLSPDGSITVAWSVPTGPGVATRAARRPGGDPATGFVPVTPPVDVASTELLPTLAADRSGGVWLATASASTTGLAFLLRRWAGTWAPTITLANGVAGRYEELGEGLGLAAAGPVLLTGVPVDGLESSSLVVRTLPVPEAPEPPTRKQEPPTTQGAAATPLDPAASRPQNKIAPLGGGLPASVTWALLALATAATALAVIILRTRRRSAP